MKIIDKTPFQDEQGNINLIARVQGTLKYGLNWYPELEAQKKVIPQLDRLLDKGFVLIRNFMLPNSEIVIPTVLVTSSSIFVILISPVKGHFEAKGAEWNEIVNNGATAPARRNLIDLIARLTRAFQKYLERFNINLPIPVEPVLICSDPGAQIESLRPIVRVVRSDAIKQFATSIMQARPVLRTDSIYALGDRIADPKSPEDQQPPVELEQERPVSRAQAIFNAEANPLDPSELEFKDEVHPGLVEPNPARRRPAAPTQKRTMGLTNRQLMLLAGMFIIECCLVAAGAGVVYFLLQ